MDFIREITYRISAQAGFPEREVYDQRTIYTLLEVPEAQKTLQDLYNDSYVEILQSRSLPYLKAQNT